MFGPTLLSRIIVNPLRSRHSHFRSIIPNSFPSHSLYRFATLLPNQTRLISSGNKDDLKLSSGEPLVVRDLQGSIHSDRSEPKFFDQTSTWLDKYRGKWFHPYLKLIRLDRPIGTWLIIFPGLSGLFLGTDLGFSNFLSLHLSDVAIFATGAFVMRSAGCTINDIWDKNFDKSVARTAGRPLASGQISTPKAWLFLAAQLSIGLSLLLQLNTAAILLGCLCVPLVIIYPLCKRFTYFPQVLLGTLMNYGIVMGTATTHPALRELPSLSNLLLRSMSNYSHEGTVHAALTTVYSSISQVSEVVHTIPLSSIAPSAIFFAGSIAWTVLYDTIYAYQDVSDDRKLGLKSTAMIIPHPVANPSLSSSEHPVLPYRLPIQWIFCLACILIPWFIVGAWSSAFTSIYLMFYFPVAYNLIYQVRSTNINDPKGLNKLFVSNKYIAATMALAIFLSHICRIEPLGIFYGW